MMYFLIGLIWVAFIWGIILFYKKKVARHNEEEARRVALLLEQFKTSHRAANSPAATPIQPLSSAPAAPVVKRRLLAAPLGLLYYIFKSALSDHEIFANLRLADLIEVTSATGAPGFAVKEGLALHKLDLVVCSKQFDVVAAVVLVAGSNAAQAVNLNFVEQRLRSAGVKLLRIDPAALPRRQDVHALVFDTQPG